MDCIDLLKAEHDRITALFREAENSESAKKKHVIFDAIRGEIETHAFIEETVFYPSFKNYAECRGFLEHAYRDHGELRRHLKEIAAITSEDAAAYQGHLDALEKTVSTHVAEEENEFFPIVRRLLKSPEREMLGRHMESAKNERREAA